MNRAARRIGGLLLVAGLTGATHQVNRLAEAEPGIIEIQRYTWEYQTHCSGGCVLGYCCYLVIPY